MSVRRIPSDAQFVDIGRPKESPLDSLTKMLELAVGGIEAYGNVIEKKDTAGATAMESLLQQIGQATSLAEIQQLKSTYNTMIDDNYVSNNPYYNVLKEQFSETNPNSAINTKTTNG